MHVIGRQTNGQTALYDFQDRAIIAVRAVKTDNENTIAKFSPESRRYAAIFST